MYEGKTHRRVTHRRQLALHRHLYLLNLGLGSDRKPWKCKPTSDAIQTAVKWPANYSLSYSLDSKRPQTLKRGLEQDLESPLGWPVSLINIKTRKELYIWKGYQHQGFVVFFFLRPIFKELHDCFKNLYQFQRNEQRGEVTRFLQWRPQTQKSRIKRGGRLGTSSDEGTRNPGKSDWRQMGKILTRMDNPEFKLVRSFKVYLSFCFILHTFTSWIISPHFKEGHHTRREYSCHVQFRRREQTFFRRMFLANSDQ